MVNVLLKSGLVFALALASVVGTSLPAYAFDFDAFRNRLDERKANLQNRSGNLPTPSIPTNEGSSDNNQEEGEPTGLECRANVDLARGDVHWSGNQLIFTPRLDVDIRARGDDPSDSWQLHFNYEGEVSFDGTGVPVPGDVTFSGSRDWSGPGGSSRFRFRGQALPSVVLAEIPRSEFGEDDELVGTVVLRGSLSGCDVDTISEQLPFEAQEFGNLRVRSWRMAR